MAKKIVYVYDKDTKEYLYPREIDVESTIENSTEVPVPDDLWGKIKWTGEKWVGQSKEEYLASLPPAPNKEPSIQEKLNATTLKNVAELQASHTAQQKLNADLMLDNANLKKQNQTQATINATLLKRVAELEKKLATTETTLQQAQEELIMFEVYESYYKMGLFTADNIKLFVEVGDLTQAEADKILQPAVAQAQIAKDS